jgi:hypothetical protein
LGQQITNPQITRILGPQILQTFVRKIGGFALCQMICIIFFIMKPSNQPTIRLPLKMTAYECTELKFLNNLWGLGTE